MLHCLDGIVLQDEQMPVLKFHLHNLLLHQVFDIIPASVYYSINVYCINENI